MIRSSIIGLAAAAALSLLPGAATAQGVNAGVLECRGIGTTGFIIGSVQELECVFRSDYMPPVRYHGIVRKFGLDVGITEQSVLAWGVLAPTARIGPGDLAGNYGGVSAGAAVVVGAGANALVGGSNNTFALQPLSVEGQTGVNVTVGVAALELRYGP
ncbi:MAG TPA: DUF992 domain-containing protein [Xanthobacteraceae bacterium]|nr:DUF992 domain-containing protein [Xanthobacteraceae bacterium]